MGWVIAAGFILLGSAADARNHFEGPVQAAVDRVVDGDTIAVIARIWVNQSLSVLVRVRGIDAPELRGRCEAERQLARRAKAYVRAALASGEVRLTNISGGKYWGRVLADVTTTEGNSIAAALLRNGLARPYQGRKRAPWCGAKPSPNVTTSALPKSPG